MTIRSDRAVGVAEKQTRDRGVHVAELGDRFAEHDSDVGDVEANN